jgi:protein LTV1
MDENTGALEMDDIEGCRQESDIVMEKLVEQFEASRESERQPLAKFDFVGRYEGKEEEVKPQSELLEIEVPKEKWDCESIISTYSNLYHHPKLISERPQKVHILHPVVHLVIFLTFRSRFLRRSQ